MTYKQIVDNIKGIVDRHNILSDFGYGQISDIKTGGDDGVADYPYAFLNYQNHTRTERAVTYRFNLIVMEMYLGDDFLTAQSQCQEYIDDILAEMKYSTQEYDIQINATLTPFKERFQDVVGGMTATIELEVPLKLNLCIAPFDAYFAKSINDVSWFVDPDNNPQNFASKWRVPIVEEDDIANISSSFITFYQAGTYLLEIEGPYTFIEPVGAEVMPSVPVITVAGMGSSISPIASNWPVVWPGAQALNWKSSYEVVIPDANASISFVSSVNQPGDESGFTQQINGNITITKIA